MQEAHEQEVATYVSNVTPLREQLEMQQLMVSTLQEQLVKAKQELAVTSVERDELSKRVLSKEVPFCSRSTEPDAAGHHSPRCEQVRTACVRYIVMDDEFELLVCMIFALYHQTFYVFMGMCRIYTYVYVMQKD